MKLSHPIDDGGYGEFRDTIERLFLESPGGLSETELDEFGLFELLEESPVLAARAIFEGQGARLGAGSTLDGYVLSALRAAGADLPAAGTAKLLIRVPGRSGTLLGVFPDPDATEHYVFSSADGAGEVLLAPASAAEPRLLRSIDPSVQLIEIDASIEQHGTVIASGLAGIIENRVHVSVGMQLTGIAEHILNTAREYSLIREQFGRPIAAFQAVQLLLADAAVAVAAAQVAGRFAIAELDDAERGGLAALCVAGAGARAAAVATRSVLQVLGAVGYTAEHEFPRYFYRSQLLSYLVGASTIDTRMAALASAGGIRELIPVHVWGRVLNGEQTA
jgi:hypothetical protein